MCEKCEQLSNTSLSYKPVNGNYPAIDEEISQRIVEATEHFSKFLEALGFDQNDPNMQDTARRVSKMYMQELFAGTWQPKPKVTVFDLPNNSISEEMIIVGPITIKSMCSHHLMPITGECYIGVLLGKNGRGVPGLSKYARIVQWYARRPQIQEQLVLQIRDDLIETLGIKEEDGGVIVVIKSEHGCMTMRGVNETSCMMTTPALYGRFYQANARTEFYSLAGIK